MNWNFSLLQVYFSIYHIKCIECIRNGEIPMQATSCAVIYEYEYIQTSRSGQILCIHIARLFNSVCNFYEPISTIPKLLTALLQHILYAFEHFPSVKCSQLHRTWWLYYTPVVSLLSVYVCSPEWQICGYCGFRFLDQ